MYTRIISTEYNHVAACNTGKKEHKRNIFQTHLTTFCTCHHSWLRLHPPLTSRADSNLSFRISDRNTSTHRKEGKKLQNKY